MGNCNRPSIDTMSEVLLTEDDLTCSICYGIMCQPSTIQPCSHTFCGGCLSEWHLKNPKCPYCREFVQLVTYNSTLDKSVSALIRENPHKARPVEEIEEIHNKNTLSYDKIFYKSITDIQREAYANNAETDEDSDDNEEMDSEDGYVVSRDYANVRVSKADIQTYILITGSSARIARETIAGAVARNLTPPLDYAISFHFIRGGHD